MEGTTDMTFRFVGPRYLMDDHNTDSDSHSNTSVSSSSSKKVSATNPTDDGRGY